MARRKDHDPDTLKALILEAARKIIAGKGLPALTARTLAKAIGYTPGTIYNFYRDMDALVTEANYVTLGELQEKCLHDVAGKPDGIQKVRALAYSYIDFAKTNAHAWKAVFAGQHTSSRLPKHYQHRLSDLFQMIEQLLRSSLNIDVATAGQATRVLWAALHGITMLTLDGRLTLLGVETPQVMVDNLLQNYFSQHIRYAA